MEVQTVFDLFEALHSVEDCFGDSIRSCSFWREKLDKALITREKTGNQIVYDSIAFTAAHYYPTNLTVKFAVFWR